jgi:hypothetical protein
MTSKEHEEMLLKHAREQHTTLIALDKVMKEIERLKKSFKQTSLIAEQFLAEKDAEIDRLKDERTATILSLRSFLSRAADALEAVRRFDFISREVLEVNGITEALIAELRKAAQ